MSFISNRVSLRLAERMSIENKIRDFETQCASKCQSLTQHEFKRWLDNEVERNLLQIFAVQKLHYTRISRDLTIDELYDCIEKITEYIYTTYRSNYFTTHETTHISSTTSISNDSVDEENQIFADEIINILRSFRNMDATVEDPTSVMMSAALENDINSALLFYDVMLSIHSNRETIASTGNFDIELEEEKEENGEEKMDCYVCFENFSKIECIKQNCLHECCATCLIKTINADKRPQPLCAMCRTPIEKLIVKTKDLKNELCKIFK